MFIFFNLFLTLKKKFIRQKKVAAKYGVTGVPHLVLLDADSGKVICEDACRKVAYSPADEFPWPN